jgi:hypothetical protein
VDPQEQVETHLPPEQQATDQTPTFYFQDS